MLRAIETVDAVMMDPPFGIRFTFRSCDDSPDQVEPMMQRLVPEIVRVTGDGPCFVWQGPLKSESWPGVFPKSCRLVAACMVYPERDGRGSCLSRNPVILWSGRSRINDELPRDWHVADFRSRDGYRGDNPVPCPRPLGQVRYFTFATR